MKEQEEKLDNNGSIDINVDENQRGTTHLNEPVAEESALEKLKDELSEEKDKFLRKVAEFDNFKRRNAKERIELIATAAEKLLVKIIPIVDDFERAEKSNAEVSDINQLKEGYQLINSKFVKLLETEGLTPVNAKGQEFNPDLHEALTQIPAPSEDLKGKVIDEIEKGYYLGEKVVRFSKVIVGA